MTENILWGPLILLRWICIRGYWVFYLILDCSDSEAFFQVVRFWNLLASVYCYLLYYYCLLNIKLEDSNCFDFCFFKSWIGCGWWMVFSLFMDIWVFDSIWLNPLIAHHVENLRNWNFVGKFMSLMGDSEWYFTCFEFLIDEG